MSDVDTGLPPLFDSLLAGATDEPMESSDDADTSDIDEDFPNRTRKPRSDKGKPRGPRGGTSTPRGRSTSDKKLADDLLNPWAKIIKAVAYPLPTMAAVMTAQAETTTGALVALASPKMKAALVKASKLGPGADLIEAVGMMLVAAAMDLGRIPPESPVAVLSGVQTFFEMTHTVVPQEQQFGRRDDDHGHTPPSGDNVHPFPSASDYPMNGSMFTSYPGVPAS